MKIIPCLAVMVVAISILAGCGTSASKSNPQSTNTSQGQGGSNQPAKIVRLGSANGSDSPENLAATHFGELVTQYTKGSVKVQVFPNSQLGTASAMLQNLTTNTVQMVITASADTINAKLQVFELPYLFPNGDVAMKVANSPVADPVNQEFLNKGMRVLAYWQNGYRQVVTTDRPITGIESMKGLRIRVINSPIWINLFKAMGASPIPMDYNQVYTGLQQGVVQAVENPITNIYAAHFHEVAKNLAMTNHSFGVSPVLISEMFWKTLTKDQQDAISKAVNETTAYDIQLAKQQDEDYLKKMEQTGVKVTNPPLQPFQDATKVVYSQLAPAIGQDLINQVQDAIKNAR